MSNKQKRFGLRLPADLHERISAAAKADRRSIHAEMLRLFEEALGAREPAQRLLAELRGRGFATTASDVLVYEEHNGSQPD